MARHARLDHPTVQLRHERPDGTAHIDWMLGQDSAGKQRLVTFRVDRRIDALGVGDELVAERVGDHRPEYLTYEGPIGPPAGSSNASDRGSVVRLCRGRIVAWTRRETSWEIEIVWTNAEDPLQRLRLDGVDSNRCHVTRLG